MEPVSRRATLATGAGLAAATLAGCGEVAAPRASASSDPDLRLVREAVRREERVRSHVQDVRSHGHRLRTALGDVAAVHRDHLALLARAVERDGKVTITAEQVRPGPGPAEQLRRLAAAERGLADLHAAAALDARSGPLARVLAGMAAAAAQQAHLVEGLAVEVSGG